MAYQHSRDAVVKIDNAAGSLTTITSYVDSVSFDQNPEQQDVTVMGSQDRQYLAGFVSNQFTMGGKQDYADDAIYDIIATATGSATTRTWELAPEGTGSGAVKYRANVSCWPPTSASPSMRRRRGRRHAGSLATSQRRPTDGHRVGKYRARRRRAVARRT